MTLLKLEPDLLTIDPCFCLRVQASCELVAVVMGPSRKPCQTVDDVLSLAGMADRHATRRHVFLSNG